MPEQALVDAAAIEERIEDQFLGVLEDPRWRRQGRAGPAADQFPEQHQQREHDQRRHDAHRGLPRHLDVLLGTRRRFGVIVTTGAAVLGEVTGMATAVASALIACIDIEIVSPRFNERAARTARGPGWIRPRHA